MTETPVDTADDSTDEAPLTSYTSESTATSSSASTGGPGPGNRGPGRGRGARKEAVARVRLVPGTGQWRVNGRTLEEYFPNKVHQQKVRDPFRVLELEDVFDVIATITGGGISGQAEALRLGVSRSLNEIDREVYRKRLKDAGFLRRDPRVKERKKYGLKKARKAPQYSKR